MRMRRLSIIGVLLGLTAPLAAEPPDARQVLQEAETALRAIEAIRYTARGDVEGVLAQRVPQMEGTVTIVAVPGEDAPKVRVDAQIIPPGQSKPVALEIACDGMFVTLAEHGQKVFIRRVLPGGGPLLNHASPLWVRELTAERPLAREANATKLEYVGTEMVGDVECDVIHAVLAEDGGEVRWHFAKTDHLPRRVQRFIDTPAGKTSITTTLHGLEPKPEVREGLFDLEKPAGFRDPTAAGLLEVGGAAPDWTLRTSDGQSVSLRGLRGKVVLLDFWATWCGPCRMAMPIVQKLHEKYKAKPVAIYGVNCYERDPKADPAGFMRSKGFSYPLLVRGDRVARAYQVEGIPTFYLIGPDGRILMASSGLSADTEKHVEALVDKLLARAGAVGG